MPQPPAKNMAANAKKLSAEATNLVAFEKSRIDDANTLAKSAKELQTLAKDMVANLTGATGVQADLMTARFALTDRLPTFIGILTSLIIFGGFERMAKLFKWDQGPNFEGDTRDAYFLSAAFAVTLFWIVTDWIAYSWRISRFPYSLEATIQGLYRFLFDAFVFSLMFLILNFSFLVTNRGSFDWFLGSLTIWYLVVSFATGAKWFGNSKRWNPISMWLLGRGGSFFILWAVYYRWKDSAYFADNNMHYYIAGTAFLFMVLINIHRLAQIKTDALSSSSDKDQGFWKFLVVKQPEWAKSKSKKISEATNE